MAVTNVRQFDGTDDKIDFAVGSAVLAPISIAVLVRRLSGGDFYQALLASGTPDTGNIFFNRTDDLLIHYTDADISTANTMSIADGWCVVGISKGTGTVACRFHKCILSTGVWSHTNGGNLDDAASQPAWAMGQSGAGNRLSGYVAAAAVWSSELSDGDFEDLDTAWANWLTGPAPTHAWRLDQEDVADGVEDQIGTAFETARTGTTVVSEDIPGFSFGDPVASFDLIGRTRSRNPSVRGVGGESPALQPKWFS